MLQIIAKIPRKPIIDSRRKNFLIYFCRILGIYRVISWSLFPSFSIHTGENAMNMSMDNICQEKYMGEARNLNSFASGKL